MEPIALGFCRLTYEEFGAMTPQEFWWRYEADMDREKRSRELIAQLACWVISPWLKKPITVRDLLPDGPVEPQPTMTNEDWKSWALANKK